VTLRSILPIITITLAGLLPASPTFAQGRLSTRGEKRHVKAPEPAVAPHAFVDVPLRTIDVRVTEKGFEPAQITLRKHERVRLVFTRETDKTCAKVLRIDEFLVWNALPLNERFATTFTAGRAGEFPYTCPTGEIQGIIKVEDEPAPGASPPNTGSPASTEFAPNRRDGRTDGG